MMYKDMPACDEGMEGLQAIWFHITSRCHASSEEELVAEFSAWIATHITYDYESYKGKTRHLGRLEDCQAKCLLDGCPAIQAIATGKALCTGYCDLVYHLCQFSNIPCVKVKGHAKGAGHIPGDPFDISCPNHVWNAVQVDGIWKLLDVSWISGYVDKSNETFYRELTSHHLFTPPRDFIRDHRPLLPKWSLLDSSVSLRDFSNQPNLGLAFHEYEFEICDIQSNGVLRIRLGECCTFRLRHSSVPILATLYGILRHDDSGIIVKNKVNISPDAHDSNVRISTFPPFPGIFVLEILIKEEHRDRKVLHLTVVISPPIPLHTATPIPHHYILNKDITTTAESNNISISDIGISNSCRITIKSQEECKLKIKFCRIKNKALITQRDIRQSVTDMTHMVHLQIRQAALYKLVVYGKLQSENRFNRWFTLLAFLRPDLDVKEACFRRANVFTGL